ncbi:MAG: pirin family protein [Planctomycetota bacterium]|nr:MAG: pirin family protein [Planctomycetota bacterium]
MIYKRPAADRGFFDHGWLKTWHSFSFGQYQDPKQMGFRALRVINEDRIAPGQGFGTHPHQDMEILTYIVSGSLAHRDSTGNQEVIQAGEVQRMTAGMGIRHSEFNGSDQEEVHLLQIWLLPQSQGLTPGYEQKEIASDAPGLSLLASREGSDSAVKIHQDVRVYGGKLQAGEPWTLSLQGRRHVWVQVIAGQVQAHGEVLHPGDGLALAEEPVVDLQAQQDAELLVFDLA